MEAGWLDGWTARAWRGLPAVLAGAFFLLVTACLHREVLSDPSARVLGGQQTGGFFAWLFWWWDCALRQGLPPFHTDRIMYPAGLPVFPHSPLNEAAALAIQAVSTPWAAVNLLLLACYALTGWTAFLLFRSRCGDPWAALCGAFTYAFSAYMVVQHFHGQLIEASLYCNPLLALAWFAFLEQPKPKRAAALAAALAGVVLSGPYVAFCFGGVFLGAAAAHDLLWGRRVLARRAALRLAGAAAGAAGLVGALAYWPLLRHAGSWIGARSFYATSLASFLDPPFWHASPLVRALRPLAGSGAAPEAVMAWLGLGTLALLAYAAADRRLRGEPEFRFWTWVLGVSVLLSLGPWLRLTPARATAVPLPYWVFAHLPVIGTFRNSARILMTATLASSALAAWVLARLYARRPPWVRAAASAGFLLFTAWEFDLPRIGERSVSTAPSAAYRRIAQDPDPGAALLELPLSYDENGDLLIHAQYYMLFQPYHRHPMVLGYPSRHLPESLAFTERTEMVYELTHPWVLRALDQRPSLAARARRLRREGGARLRAAGIRWVLYHPAVPAYDPDTRRRLEAWLGAALGRPVLAAEDGALLFRT